MTDQLLVPVEHIAGTILTLRGQRVILDSELARLYGTTTTRLNQAVKRNAARFPDDFMFQITTKERDEVITICDNLSRIKFSPRLPSVFTEHGAVMAATILNIPRAVEVSVFVVRAFIQQRAMLANHAELSLQLERLERKLISGINLLREHDDTLTAHESQIEDLIEAVNALRTPPDSPRRPIGFCTDADEER